MAGAGAGAADSAALSSSLTPFDRRLDFRADEGETSACGAAGAEIESLLDRLRPFPAWSGAAASPAPSPVDPASATVPVAAFPSPPLAAVAGPAAVAVAVAVAVAASGAATTSEAGAVLAAVLMRLCIAFVFASILSASYNGKKGV